MSDWIGRISEISAGGRHSEQKAKVRKGQVVWPSSEDPRCVLSPSKEEGPALLGAKVL